MEPNQMDTQPVAAPALPPAKTSYGALIALVVVVLAIAAAAFYFMNQRMMMADVPATAESLTQQSTSTDQAAIESDLSTGSPDDFDKGVDQAFGELDASFETQ